MKRKILIIVYVISILIMINLLYIIIKNNFIVNEYKNGKYLETQAKILTDITFQKSYISNYNYGNILYQNGEYEKAIIEYKKALKFVTSSKRECKIRINCALAICKSVQIDENNQESIEKAIETYQEAIKILTEKDCNNHNQDAKKLKNDIEKEIDRLKKLQKNTDDKSDENKKDDKEQQKNQENIEEKIQNIKEEATNEQREMEELYKNFNKDYKNRGKNW